VGCSFALCPQIPPGYGPEPQLEWRVWWGALRNAFGVIRFVQDLPVTTGALTWDFAPDRSRQAWIAPSGPTGIRTPDLLAASQALYQLSYGPSGVRV
jgi:hypothetical protein